jgi:hypothetical protein
VIRTARQCSGRARGGGDLQKDVNLPSKQLSNFGIISTSPNLRGRFLKLGPASCGVFLLWPPGVLNDPIEPMTLANMRENGVRSLAICCRRCHREMIFNVDQWPAETEVPCFGRCMVCTKCGTIGADVRPNWRDVTR